MIKWKEYIESRTFLKHRCKFCRRWFNEKDDIKVHLIKEHEVMDKIEIKYCKEGKACFVPIMENQVICGRKECLLKN